MLVLARVRLFCRLGRERYLQLFRYLVLLNQTPQKREKREEQVIWLTIYKKRVSIRLKLPQPLVYDIL
jgi:hypothetical protein